MHLYAVKVHTIAVVFAETPMGALAVASENRREMIEPSDITVISQISSFDDLPSGWDVDCIPWGQTDDETIANILKNPMFERLRFLELENQKLRKERNDLRGALYDKG